jgi:hypothetical protein
MRPKPIHIRDCMGPTGKGPACFSSTGRPDRPRRCRRFLGRRLLVMSYYTLPVCSSSGWILALRLTARTSSTGQSAADTFYYSITPMQTHRTSIALSLSLALNPEIYTRGERAHSIREMSPAARPCVVHKRATPTAVDESKLGINRRLSTGGARKTTK